MKKHTCVYVCMHVCMHVYACSVCMGYMSLCTRMCVSMYDMNIILYGIGMMK